MRDEGSLAMHDLLGADDPAAKRFADGLGAQAHAQYRLLAGEVLEDFHRDARCAGAFGPGEMQIRSGFSASICSIVISSLR